MAASKYVIDDNPILVMPKIACALGVPEAMIIQQIHYWYMNPKVGVMKDGHKWVYNGYSEWEEQFPFYSRNTIIRAIRHLEQSGVIITKQYNSSTNNHIKFYRVDHDKLDIVISAYLVVPNLGIPPLKGKKQFGGTQNGYTSSKILVDLKNDLGNSIYIDYTETTTKTSSGSKAKALTKSKSKPVIEKPQGEEMKGPTTTKQILDHKKALENKEPEKPVKVNGKLLQEIWRKEYPEFVPTFTDPQKGMFNHIAKRITDSNLVMKYVMNNWILFTKYLESTAAVKTTSLMPTIPLMLKYCGEAFNFYQENKPKPKVKLIALEPEKKVVEPNQVGEYHEHKPASLEKILSMTKKPVKSS